MLLHVINLPRDGLRGAEANVLDCDIEEGR